MTHEPSKIKVAAIVLNSVSHDARVLKEAASLSQAGYQITLIGIRDKKCAEPKTVLDNGVTIYRSDLNSLIVAMNILGTLILLSVPLIILLLLLSTVVIYDMSGMPKYILGSFTSFIAFLYLFSTYGLYKSAKIKRAEWLSQFGFLDERSHERMPKKTGLSKYMAHGVRRLILRRWKRTMRGEGEQVEVIHYMVYGVRRIRYLVRRIRYGVRRLILRVVRATCLVALRCAKPCLRPLFLYLKWKACLWTSLKQMNNLHPDFIHCHDLTTLRIGTAYKKAHPETKVIFDSHELYEEVSNMKPALRRYWKRVARKHAKHVDGFITVNQSIAEELKSRYPALPNPVVICNAVKWSGPLPPYDGRLHDAANLAPHIRILLYQGGYARHRGLEVLVEAAADLPDDWVLVMMGWGNLEQELRTLSSQTDPGGDKTRFIPPAPQHELQLWTSGASLGAIPYENVCMNHWFCSPNKLWEYPAAGVPILASPFPELTRIVTGEGVGIELSPELTPDDIVAKVSELDDTRLKSLRSNCSTFIQKDNWSVYESRILSLYSDLAPRPGIHTRKVEHPNATVHV